MTDSDPHLMPRSKIAIAVDEKLLRALDQLVRSKVFRSRSQAFQIALEEKVARLQSRRLARECAKLDPASEQVLADEGLASDAQRWPEY